jgi:hypothetical protein
MAALGRLSEASIPANCRFFPHILPTRGWQFMRKTHSPKFSLETSCFSLQANWL